jgi:hypothetical protein
VLSQLPVLGSRKKYRKKSSVIMWNKQIEPVIEEQGIVYCSYFQNQTEEAKVNYEENSNIAKKIV